MRNARIIYAVVVWLACLTLPAAAGPIELSVAPDGLDANPGTKDRPLASLAGARDAIRALKRQGALPAGGVTVSISSGTYRIAKTLALGAQDSGSADAPIIYRAAPGASVRLLGGPILGDSAPVTDRAILDRLDPAVRGKVVQYDLKQAGVTEIGELKSRGFSRPIQPAHLELFYAGRPMQLARWPNEGFVQISGIPGAVGDDGHGGKLGELKAGFVLADPRPRNWKRSTEAWIYGYWAWDWAATYERLDSYDPQTGLIKTAPPHGMYGFRVKQRIAFLNVLEELDQPGEYYVDRAAGVLYFYPPVPPTTGAAKPEAVVSVLATPIISMDNVAFVAFRGMSLECTRGNGIVIAGGQDCAIETVSLQKIGNWAVRVEGGLRHRVLGCDVAQTGDGGVYIQGGDRQKLTSGEHRVEDCRFTDIARWSKCYAPAVQIAGVGNVLAHCEIARHPHAGVLFSGNEHRIEFNDVHHTCLETGDVGAIYIGRDWTMRGNVIRHNYFHDITGPGLYGAQAVYLDDQSSGSTVTGNIFVNVQRAVLIGGGRDNTVDNNLFLGCREGVAIDGRGLDNKPVWRDQTFVDLKKKLEAINPDQPPYATRYPELARIKPYLADAAASKGVPPEGNVVKQNLFIGPGKWLTISWHAAPEMVATTQNTTPKTPAEAGFLDPADPLKERFGLRADAPAIKAGFVPIPFAEIGPRMPARAAKNK